MAQNKEAPLFHIFTYTNAPCCRSTWTSYRYSNVSSILVAIEAITAALSQWPCRYVTRSATGLLQSYQIYFVFFGLLGKPEQLMWWWSLNLFSLILSAGQGNCAILKSLKVKYHDTQAHTYVESCFISQVMSPSVNCSRTLPRQYVRNHELWWMKATWRVLLIAGLKLGATVRVLLVVEIECVSQMYLGWVAPNPSDRFDI